MIATHEKLHECRQLVLIDPDDELARKALDCAQKQSDLALEAFNRAFLEFSDVLQSIPAGTSRARAHSH